MMQQGGELDSLSGANLAANLVNMEVNLRQVQLMEQQLRHDEMNLLIVALLLDIRNALRGDDNGSD